MHRFGDPSPLCRHEGLRRGVWRVHPDEYVKWFLPYVSQIARILKPTGSFILNLNDKVVDTFRHPFVFELIYAIHNSQDYCNLKGIKEGVDHEIMRGFRMFERLFWNKGNTSLTRNDLVTKSNTSSGFQNKRIGN